MNRQSNSDGRGSAASLSLTSATKALEGNEYEQAVNCAAAIKATNGVLESTGALGTAELGAMRQAAQYFERRSLSLAATYGKSRSQAEADLDAAERADAEGGTSSTANDALACMRKLASGA